MVQRILALIVCLATAGFAAADSRVLAVGEYNGTVFEVRQFRAGGVDSHVSWTQAEAEATALGGHLATVEDGNENDFLYALASPHSDWTNNRMWLGGSDRAGEGWWRWQTEEPWSFARWSPGEPNNAGGVEHFLMMCVYDGNCPNPGRWNDLADGAHFGLFAVEYGDPGPQPVEKILFMSNRDGGDWDTWMMNPDGTQVERLIGGPNSQQGSRVSPDGRKVLYQDYSSGSAELKIFDLATGTSSWLLESSASVDWRGDGSGFLGSLGGCNSRPIAIDLDGNAWTPFSESGRQAFGDVDWTTDKIFYTKDPCNSPSTAVRVYDPTSGTVSTIKAANGRSEGHLSVSSDGSLVAFFEHDWSYTGPAHLYVMNPDGSNIRQVTTTTGQIDFHPHFSPDGSRIAFSRLTGDRMEVRVVNLETGEETLLLPGDVSRVMDWTYLYLPPDCEPGGEIEVTISNPVPGAHVDIRYGEHDMPDGSTVTLTDGETVQWRLNAGGYNSGWKTFTASCEDRTLEVTNDDYCELAIANPVPEAKVDLRYGPQNLEDGDTVFVPKGTTIHWRLEVSGYHGGWRSFVVDDGCVLAVTDDDYCAILVSNPIPGGHVDFRYGPQDLEDGASVSMPKGLEFQWRLNASGYNGSWKRLSVGDSCTVAVTEADYCAVVVDNPVPSGHVDLRYGPQDLSDGSIVPLPKDLTLQWRLHASGYNGPWQTTIVDEGCALSVTSGEYCDTIISNPVPGAHVDLRYGAQDLLDGMSLPLPTGISLQWRLHASGYNSSWKPHVVAEPCEIPVTGDDYCGLVVEIPAGAEVDLRYGPQNLVNGAEVDLPRGKTIQWRITIDGSIGSWNPMVVGENGCRLTY